MYRERETALRADLERVQRERETALRADLKREYKQKKELQKRAYEAELERLQYEVDLEWLQYGTELEWRQSENVVIPVFPLLEGPQQSALTAVALAAEAPAAEVMNGTRVFPDTAAPDASVERAAIKLTSAARTSSEICRERGASNHPFDPGTVLPLVVRYHNSSWPKHGSNSNRNSSSNGSNSNSSSSSNSSGYGSDSSSNDTTRNYGPCWDTICVVELLRPFDPGKGFQRDARREKTVITGVDLPFDRGKSWK